MLKHVQASEILHRLVMQQNQASASVVSEDRVGGASDYSLHDPQEHRPAFNLVLVLWRAERRDDAAVLWLSWRFAEFPHLQFPAAGAPRSASSEKVAKICERLIAEVSGERNRLLGEKHSSARITSHVVGPNSDFDAGKNLTYPHSHASMAENRTDVPESTVPLMQLCLLDLMILEYTLRRFQGGGSS